MFVVFVKGGERKKRIVSLTWQLTGGGRGGGGGGDIYFNGLGDED